MRKTSALPLLLLLAVAHPSQPATKEAERPDKEMLRMMDFLREIEMIKQAEMMQELSQVEQAGDQISDTRGRKPLPAKRKEASK
jgi:hypothetical protein